MCLRCCAQYFLEMVHKTLSKDEFEHMHRILCAWQQGAMQRNVACYILEITVFKEHPELNFLFADYMRVSTMNSCVS